MRKLLFAAVLAALCAHAGAATWNVFADDSDGMADQVVFFDADSVVRRGDAVTVLFETLRDAETDMGATRYKSLTRLTFDCDARTVQAGDEDESDLDGHTFHRSRTGIPAMRADPDSYEGHWLRAACSATFPKPQPKDEFSRVPDNDPAAVAQAYFAGHRAKWAARRDDLPPEHPRAPREDCADIPFTYAVSAGQLPADLLEALEQRGRVADRGGAFNATDVASDAPRRRFAGAAVSDRRAYVAVEQGGYAHNTQMWRFTRDGDRWSGKHLWYIGAPPATLAAVLSIACRQNAPAPAAGRPPRPRISCSERDDDHSISVGYLDSEVDFDYTLDRKSVARGLTRRGRIVLTGGRDDEPSPYEVASAQALLQAARSSPDNRCPAPLLDEFMQALGGHEVLKPVSPADPWLRSAREAAYHGDNQAAREALDRACAADPRDAEAFKARGDFLYRENDKQAELDYGTALRLDPTLTQVRFERANLLSSRFYNGRQDADRAAAAGDLAILDKELPDYSDQRQAMAFMDDLLEMPAQELAQWKLWIPAHGDEGRSFLAQRCWARVRLGIELPQALEDCDAAVKGGRNIAYVYEYRGWAWLRSGRPDTALADFGKALAVVGTTSAKSDDLDLSLYGRALAHERLGQAAAAKADYARVHRMAPYVESFAVHKGLVPRSALSDAQDREVAELLARSRGQ